MNTKRATGSFAFKQCVTMSPAARRKRSTTVEKHALALEITFIVEHVHEVFFLQLLLGR